ncbi:MAG: hypothetical protein QE263_07005 [Vampirovibrionales bacterium]|nr:hypothetical protein [Vampirovibrionales bacterium]
MLSALMFMPLHSFRSSAPRFGAVDEFGVFINPNPPKATNVTTDLSSAPGGLLDKVIDLFETDLVTAGELIDQQPPLVQQALRNKLWQHLLPNDKG